MTPKQARFVEEYLIDLNATQAYIRAGYAENGAHKNAPTLMANQGIAAAIAAKQAVISENTGRSVESVLANLEQDRALARALGQPSAAISATVHIGKHIGMWPTTVTVRTPQLMQEAEKLAAELGLTVEDVLKEADAVLEESK